jgi:uroporphyrin-III C-methyltransferase
MAMSRLEAIMDIFSSKGKHHLPVAIIQNGTTPQQKMVTGTVADIAMRAQAAGIGNPAVIIAGEVVGLRRNIDHIIHTAAAYEEKQAGL